MIQYVCLGSSKLPGKASNNSWNTQLTMKHEKVRLSYKILNFSKDVLKAGNVLERSTLARRRLKRKYSKRRAHPAHRGCS